MVKSFVEFNKITKITQISHLEFDYFLDIPVNRRV